jgi:L-fucose isomerase
MQRMPRGKSETRDALSLPEVYAGGGARVNLMTRPGQATTARLNRAEGRHGMDIILAEFEELPRKKIAETAEEWPHALAKLRSEHQIFLQEILANHCRAVYRGHVQELKRICGMIKMDVNILGS